MENINYLNATKQDTNDQDHWATDVPHNVQAKNRLELIGPDYPNSNETRGAIPGKAGKAQALP